MAPVMPPRLPAAECFQPDNFFFPSPSFVDGGGISVSVVATGTGVRLDEADDDVDRSIPDQDVGLELDADIADVRRVPCRVG